MGAPFIDYIIADKIIIPHGLREHYSEKIIYLPHSYQVNDNSERFRIVPLVGLRWAFPNGDLCSVVSTTTIRFRQESLMSGCVCCNKSMAACCGCSRQTNGRHKILEKSRSRGIDPDRLVFADRMPSPEHLSRLRLADLFLDTFNFNAHTTASDALRMGVPVVTKLGHGFPSRVAGSLLNAIGLPELATTSAEQYERLALDLATNAETLAKKWRLLEHRDTAPLFDTEHFAKHIERAYQQAYQRYFDGKEPDHIEVAES